DVVDCEVRLPYVEGRQGVPGYLRDLLRRLTSDALPLVHVHDLEVLLREVLVVRRKPREPGGGIAVGIDARVVGAESLHLVEAVRDRVRLRLVAQVPLAREIGRIAVLLEELGDRGGVSLRR